MAGVNKAILVGNLGADPDLRETDSGKKVCRMSLATSRRYKKGDDTIDETEWHRITAWEKTAELCKEFLKKGSSVYVEGFLRTNKYSIEGEEKPRYSTEIIAQNVQFLDRKPTTKNESDDSWSNPPDEDEFDF